MLQLKHSILQRLLWPFTPASAVTGTQELSLLPTLFSDLPHKGFFSLHIQSSKNEKTWKCTKYSLCVGLNQFLKNCFSPWKFLFWRAKEQGWMHGAKTTISRYKENLLSTTQQHPGSLVFYESCWNKIFQRVQKTSLFYHNLMPRRDTFQLSPLLVLQILLHFYLWNPKLQ